MPAGQWLRELSSGFKSPSGRAPRSRDSGAYNAFSALLFDPIGWVHRGLLIRKLRALGAVITYAGSSPITEPSPSRVSSSAARRAVSAGGRGAQRRDQGLRKLIGFGAGATKKGQRA